jgi:hypothetical protein
LSFSERRTPRSSYTGSSFICFSYVSSLLFLLLKVGALIFFVSANLHLITLATAFGRLVVVWWTSLSWDGLLQKLSCDFSSTCVSKMLINCITIMRMEGVVGR